MSFTGPLEDRLLIRERMSAYADAAFRQDEEAYLACWSENAVRVGQGATVQGTAALRAQWRGFWQFLESMAFFTEVGGIEVNGDHAAARCYCREIMTLKGGGLWKVTGVYADELVREGDAWLFARREYTLLLDEGRPGGV
ncbi:MAG: nuclear transport factor 2 family protein [Sphingomonadales bacterium]|nr:nuclear transport factor 2 family protein [Sphingomonadales bacterium]